VNRRQLAGGETAAAWLAAPTNILTTFLRGYRATIQNQRTRPMPLVWDSAMVA